MITRQSRAADRIVINRSTHGTPDKPSGSSQVTAERHPATGKLRDRRNGAAVARRASVSRVQSLLSVEPAMRGWVSAVANYSAPVGIGEVMRSFCAGRVVASRHPDFAEGDAVMGMLGWQEFAISDGSAVTRKVMESDLPLSLSLGILGLNGVTAYFGLLDVGQPRPGDTVVVSTAAGAVGSAGGPIAKLMGCRAGGLTGGPVKAALCREAFGYDAVIDYKTNNIFQALSAACPRRGVDLYFDNTSGHISDA